MAKGLIEEGTKVWKLMSQNNHHIRWESAVYEIEEQFMKISSCGSRSLTHQVLFSVLSVYGKYFIVGIAHCCCEVTFFVRI